MDSVFEDVQTESHAFVADVDVGSGDQLLHLLLRLAAERTLHELPTVTEFGHGGNPRARVIVLNYSERHQVAESRAEFEGGFTFALVSGEGLSPEEQETP
jgi:hypothetical protein